ncbi:hypothetical protein AB0D11_36120 [Streptomyces monashensis]|uniref:hypothetical protein n=1 Tax=Streptomyces monashensis TaxID=1678012 RepID=UPI0033C4F9DA
MSLRDITGRLADTMGAEKGLHPSSATVTPMLRGHDERAVQRRTPDRPTALRLMSRLKLRV